MYTLKHGSYSNGNCFVAMYKKYIRLAHLYVPNYSLELMEEYSDNGRGLLYIVYYNNYAFLHAPVGDITSLLL